MTDQIPLVRPVAVVTEDVLSRAVAGDEAAFASLYVDVQPRLHRYAWSLVGSDAEDVTGEAWLQIVRDLGSFSGDLDAFRAWTARVVRNRALDHVRARNRRPAEPLVTAYTVSYAAPDDTALSAEERISTETAVRLIAELPHEQAEAVLLRAVVGLSAAAAGEVLGKSAAAVRVAAHRGLRTLRRRVTAPQRVGAA